MTEPVDLTPDLNVEEMLKHYPALEATLLELAPGLSRLKNPVLLKTVHRHMDLTQVAQMVEMPVCDLLQRLRAAAGLKPQELSSEPPGWISSCEETQHFDADAMIAQGLVPVGPVMKAASELQTGQMLCLEASFRPGPLLDKLAQAGHPTHVQVDSGRHRCWIGAKA